MTDHRDDTGRRQRELAVPLLAEDLDTIESGPVVGLPTVAGPLHDDVRRQDITGRYTALGDHPALQRAFRRLAEQREEDRRELEKTIDDLEDALRKRIHDVVKDTTAAIAVVSNAQGEHAVEDAERHADLAGRPGGGPGRVGILEKRLAQVDDAQAGLATIRRGDDARIGKLEASEARREKGKAKRIAAVSGLAGAVFAALLGAGAAYKNSVYAAGRKDSAAERLVETVRENRAALDVIKAVLYARGLLQPPAAATPEPLGDTP